MSLGSYWGFVRDSLCGGPTSQNMVKEYWVTGRCGTTDPAEAVPGIVGPHGDWVTTCGCLPRKRGRVRVGLTLAKCVGDVIWW